MGTAMSLLIAPFHLAVHRQVGGSGYPHHEILEASRAGRILHPQQVFWALPWVKMGWGLNQLGLEQGKWRWQKWSLKKGSLNLLSTYQVRIPY